MNHLEYPFEESIRVEIKNGKESFIIECELASSEIEIYQSLSYRRSKDFKKPMILLFNDHTKQHFSKHSFAFPVVQACVHYKSKLVKKLSFISKAKEDSGGYIQAFSEFSLALLLPYKSDLVKKIVTDKTRITIKRK
jgi:hypothetical protein